MFVFGIVFVVLCWPGRPTINVEFSLNNSNVYTIHDCVCVSLRNLRKEKSRLMIFQFQPSSCCIQMDAHIPPSIAGGISSMNTRLHSQSSVRIGSRSRHYVLSQATTISRTGIGWPNHSDDYRHNTHHFNTKQIPITKRFSYPWTIQQNP